ncbi:MAG: hypothetical protein JWO68_3550 [Actinomycetia bacterium]|nr:hypothetical protein [Actinomycetes bacterium]
MSEVTVAVRDVDGETFPIIGGSADEGVLAGIRRSDGNYEPHVLRALARFLTPDAVCLDIGANIGVVAVFLGRHCPDGVVHAFEPGQETGRYLAANIAANGLENVVVHPLGLYDQDGTLVLNYNEHHPGGAFISDTEATDGDQESIAVRTLDSWAAEVGLDRLDVVKMDVEGAELRVLAGAVDTLRRFRPKLILECNPVPLRRFQGATADALVSALEAAMGPLVRILQDGTFERLGERRHLHAALAEEGIVELVGGVDPDAIGAKVPPRRRRRRLAALPLPGFVRRRVSWLAEIPFNYVYDPSFRGSLGATRREAAAGSTFRVPVRLRNDSRFWWSSGFPHPVNLSYRWWSADGGTCLDRGDGQRTLLAKPVRPGGRFRAELEVRAPDEPGSYVLGVTMVQEAFSWFDDLDPRLRLGLPVDVR